MPDLLRSALCASCVLLALVAATPAGAAKARNEDALTATLAGEFALQAGRLDEAARWYLDAARATPGDAGLAERATRIALLTSDSRRVGAALALWRQRAPDAPAMHAAEVMLALRQDDARAARRGLQVLFARKAGGADAGWRYALAALGSGGKDPKLAARLLGE
ncbi:MAG: hypothetical protein HOQ02_06540, partial [Lysobacter sp.]|nr:hypothetical protein [Lysobacter sp.]